MMDVPIAANTLGTIGAVCWSIQLVPQIIINYRRHHAIGLQASMMMLWACAGIPLGVYNVSRDFNIALQIQPQILTTLSLITWIQCYYYQRNWSISKCLLVVCPLLVLMGGAEIGLVFALRRAKDNQLEWPLTLMAVLAAVLLAAGVSAHYVDIYKHSTVRGISFIFVGIDAAGDLFSLLSILFQPELDVLGLVVYATELALWCGVMSCGVWFNLIPLLRNHTRSSERGHGHSASFSSAQNARSSARITLHDLGSSTSVFRTQSGMSAARSVPGVALRHVDHNAFVRPLSPATI